MPETLLSASNILLFGRVVTDLAIVHNAQDPGPPPAAITHDPFRIIRGRVSDGNQQLETLVNNNTANFARIYAVSFEGQFYELPAPVLFLVHDAGHPAETTVGSSGGAGHARQSRAPDNPDRSGLGAADFSFADDLMVWSYDKADYTIRMDVETGMFEQVLLDVVFDGGGPGGIAGANVRGANVRGANVRGANVRGANVRGANVRGANVRGANVRGGGGGD